MSNFLEAIYKTVSERKGADECASYTAQLFAKGRAKIAQKVGEEAVEVVLAKDDKTALISESADLLFHLCVLWADAGVTPDDIAAELARRKGTSGLTEKANRTS